MAVAGQPPTMHSPTGHHATGFVTAASNRSGIWFTHRGYALATTMRRLLAQKFSSGLTLAVIGVVLSLPLLLILLSPDVTRLDPKTLQTPGLVAYLDTGLSDIDGSRLADRLSTRVNIETAEYISKGEALALLEADGEMQATIEAIGENPLPGSILVKAPGSDAQDAGTQKLLAETLRAIPGVTRVDVDIEWIERLNAVVSFARFVGWASFLVLAIACLMVISNTIRLEALRHTRASEIAHLLGARRNFRRRPFVYLGAVYGLLGACIATMLAFGALLVLREPIEGLAKSYALNYTLPSPSLSILGIFVISCTVLGMLAALISVKRVNPDYKS